MDSNPEVQQPKELSIDLSIEDVNAVLEVLGALPTKSGAWPLLMKIKSQAELQLSKKE